MYYLLNNLCFQQIKKRLWWIFLCTQGYSNWFIIQLKIHALYLQHWIHVIVETVKNIKKFNKHQLIGETLKMPSPADAEKAYWNDWFGDVMSILIALAQEWGHCKIDLRYFLGSSITNSSVDFTIYSYILIFVYGPPPLAS